MLFIQEPGFSHKFTLPCASVTWCHYDFNPSILALWLFSLLSNPLPAIRILLDCSLFFLLSQNPPSQTSGTDWLSLLLLFSVFRGQLWMHSSCEVKNSQMLQILTRTQHKNSSDLGVVFWGRWYLVYTVESRKAKYGP